MITLKDYLMGRDVQYPEQYTTDVGMSAISLLNRVNALLNIFIADNPKASARHVTSGWRPPTVNKTIKGAAKKSNHMTGHAVDLTDDDGELDAWCMTAQGRESMEQCGLYLEHPSATPRWCHLQDVAPRSGNRVFYP